EPGPGTVRGRGQSLGHNGLAGVSPVASYVRASPQLSVGFPADSWSDWLAVFTGATVRVRIRTAGSQKRTRAGDRARLNLRESITCNGHRVARPWGVISRNTMRHCRFLVAVLFFAGLCAAQQATARAAATPASDQQLSAAPTATMVVSNTAVPQNLNFVQRGGWFTMWQRYRPANVGMPDLRNVAPWQKSPAAGTVYLSLQQVLRLSLMADLDVAD